MTVKSKVKTMPKSWENILNIACVIKDNKTLDCDEDNPPTPTGPKVTIVKKILSGDKLVDSITAEVWDTITYIVTFKNVGKTGTYVSLKDFLPDGVQISSSKIEVKSNTTSWWEKDTAWESVPYKWSFTKIQRVYVNVYTWVYLWAGWEWVMTIQWEITEDGSDLNRTNFACIYDENGNKVACDDAVYNIEEKEVQCKSLDWVSGNVTVQSNSEEVTKKVTCKSSWGKADITIICGGEEETKKSTDSFTKECSFTGVWSHVVTCNVTNSKNKVSKCEESFEIKTPDYPKTPVCRDMDVDRSENEVTCRANKAVKFKVNWCVRKDGKYESKEKDTKWTFECDEILDDVKCTVSDDGYFDWSNTTKTCEESRDEDTTKTTPWQQTCFNVNAWNFSIEEWEILPFYWNLDKVTRVVGEHPYDQIDGEYENAKDKINPTNGYIGSSCKYPEAIATDSMVCTFWIYDWWKYFKWYKKGEGTIENPLYKIKGPCLSNMTQDEMPEILQDWYSKMKNRYCKSNDKDCLSFELPEYESRLPEDRRWEYPELLYSSVYYIEDFWRWGINTIHLANLWGSSWWLKSPSEWSEKKSYWEYKIVLESVEYLECLSDGENLSWQMMTGDVTKCQSNFMLTNSYTVQKTPSWNLTASTQKLKEYLDIEWNNQNFADTYLKAIATTTYKANNNVDEALESFKKKYEKLAVNVSSSNLTKSNPWVTIKKVPGKSIYFVEWDNITINWKKDINNPFTIVTDWKVTISWDVKYNMMVLAKDIAFKWNCTSNQKVKWIYYAKGSLSREWIVKNTRSATTWCSEWGLHIQWVLIWDKFEDLMTASRSNINNWFAIKNYEDKANERRKIIMNWASVLIEYSPSIFTKSTMPPGAEDFTTALSIYKQ